MKKGMNIFELSKYKLNDIHIKQFFKILHLNIVYLIVTRRKNFQISFRGFNGGSKSNQGPTSGFLFYLLEMLRAENTINAKK